MQPTNQNQQLSDSCETTTQTKAQTAKMITDLWGVMLALYGVKWSSQFGEKTDVTGQWAQTLSGLSRGQIAFAIDAIRKSGRVWPPSAPEFRAMCLSPQLNAPTTEAAYAMALEYQRGEVAAKDLHPMVYHTITKNLDGYQFKRLAMEKAQEAFRFAYKATIEHVATGRQLNRFEPPAALISHATAIANPEEAEKSRAKLMNMFKTERKEPKTIEQLADDARLERIRNEK